MSERKRFIFSGALSLLFAGVVCVAGVVYARQMDVRISEIKATLGETSWPENTEILHKEIASLVIPLREEQDKEESERVRMKKPDLLIAPEQLQGFWK